MRPDQPTPLPGCKQSKIRSSLSLRRERRATPAKFSFPWRNPPGLMVPRIVPGANNDGRTEELGELVEKTFQAQLKIG